MSSFNLQVDVELVLANVRGALKWEIVGLDVEIQGLWAVFQNNHGELTFAYHGYTVTVTDNRKMEISDASGD